MLSTNEKVFKKKKNSKKESRHRWSRKRKPPSRQNRGFHEIPRGVMVDILSSRLKGRRKCSSRCLRVLYRIGWNRRGFPDVCEGVATTSVRRPATDGNRLCDEKIIGGSGLSRGDSIARTNTRCRRVKRQFKSEDECTRGRMFDGRGGWPCSLKKNV